MKIEEVRATLAKVIEEKKNFLRGQLEAAEKHGMSDREYSTWNTMASMLRKNIIELEDILHDIDQCIGKEGTISWAETL